MDSRRRAQWGLRTPSCQRDDKDIQPPALAWTEHAGKESKGVRAENMVKRPQAPRLGAGAPPSTSQEQTAGPPRAPAAPQSKASFATGRLCI